MRGLDLDPECALDPDHFYSAIRDLVSVPFVRFPHLQLTTSTDQRRLSVRPGLVSVDTVTVGGGRLSPAKDSHLRDVAERNADRSYLYRVLRTTIRRFGPILYVGEAGNLRERIDAHLQSKTELLAHAFDLGMTIHDLLLYYLPLPQFDRSTRTLIEQLLTHILVAPLTKETGLTGAPMAKKPPSPIALHNSTEQIDVRFGAFELSGGFRVPYMASVLRFQQAAEYLDLVTADPKYVKQDWQVEELFQREVSQTRVIELVEHYLKSESRPQFFNSLTIVLRPRETTSTGYQPPHPAPEYEKHLALGPIVVSYDERDPRDDYPLPLSHGRLAWNRRQVYAVAIDGQHRLAAIKELNRDALHTSSLSVLFIVLDSALGFSAPTDWTPLTAMRSIFIDLNKRAMPVSRARNLLLDDLDPSAQFVRRLFGPALNVDFQNEDGPCGFPMGKNREFDTRIPLVLVDWHGETRSKIEQGPYLSSVLALDWIVKKTLDARHPRKPAIPNLLEMSVDEENYHDQIRSSLQHWESSWHAGRIQEHWAECKENDQPFFLTSQEVHCLADEYENTWGRPITRILSTVGPYARLVELRMRAGTLTPQFSQWYQARSDRDAHAKSKIRIRTHYQHRLERIEEALKMDVSLPSYRATLADIEALKRESLFFYLVGQRALVLSLISLVESRDGPDLAEACGLPIADYSNIQDFCADYLGQAIDSMWKSAPRLFTKPFRVARDVTGETEELPDAFWAGTLVKRDQTEQIDFSEKAAQRGARWFSLMAHLYWFVETNDLSDPDDVELIVSAVDDESVLDDYEIGP